MSTGEASDRLRLKSPDRQPWRGLSRYTGFFDSAKMHAAVRMVYLDGYKLVHNSAPVVGQVISELSHGIILLNLWPLEWVANAAHGSFRPLATLWRPELCAMHCGTFAVRGLEGSDSRRGKRWQLQKWVCEVLDPIRAREYGKTLGELSRSM